jgi:hypothetical protein
VSKKGLQRVKKGAKMVTWVALQRPARPGGGQYAATVQALDGCSAHGVGGGVLIDCGSDGAEAGIRRRWRCGRGALMVQFLLRPL